MPAVCTTRVQRNASPRSVARAIKSRREVPITVSSLMVHVARDATTQLTGIPLVLTSDVSAMRINASVAELDVGPPEQIPIARRFCTDHVQEFLRGVAHRADVERSELLPDRGIFCGCFYGLCNPGHHIARHLGRSGKTPPRSEIQFRYGDPCFSERGDRRKSLRPARAGDCNRVQAAIGDGTPYRTDSGEHH